MHEGQIQRFLGSISSMFYEQLLRTQILKVQKSQSFFAFLEFAAAHRMLKKLTPDMSTTLSKENPFWSFFSTLCGYFIKYLILVTNLVALKTGGIGYLVN